jgi:hypothetical protein
MEKIDANVKLEKTISKYLYFFRNKGRAPVPFKKPHNSLTNPGIPAKINARQPRCISTPPGASSDITTEKPTYHYWR